MLKIEHLKKNYENFSLDCSLEVKKGHVTGLIGQNGAGKSQTFKAILESEMILFFTVVVPSLHLRIFYDLGVSYQHSNELLKFQQP